MSVKTTQTLTRKMAEDRFRIMVMNVYGHDWIAGLSDTELEDQLERVDDHMCGGESFRNYRIVPDYTYEGEK